MAGIFDTEISSSKEIQQSISDPGFAAPSKGVDYNISPEDIYNLRGSTRIKQLNAQAEAEKAARDAAKAKAAASERLQGLTSGLIDKYKQIDNTITNPVEANRLKYELKLTALQAGGKENAGYINSILDQLTTKRQARSDGMVEVVDSKGNVIGLEAGDRDALIAGREDRHVQKVDEVFPDVIDTLQGLIDVDANRGNHIQDKSVTSIIGTLKNSAGALKGISDDWQIRASKTSGKDLEVLTKRAEADYLRTASQAFSVLTEDDILKGIRSGDIDRSDIEIFAQQLKRNFISDITENGVPVDVNKVDSYISGMLEDLNKSYENIQTNDLISLTNMKNTLQAQQDIKRLKYEGRLNIPEVEGAGKALDFMAKAAGIAKTFGEAADNPLLPAEDREFFTGLSRGAGTVAEGMQPVVEGIGKHLYQSSFDFQDYKREISKADNREDALGALRKLAKITNHEAGYAHANQVAGIVEESADKLIQLTEKGEITVAELQGMVDSLDQYQADAREKIKSAGYTPEQYVEESEEAMRFYEKAWGVVYPKIRGVALGQPNTKLGAYLIQKTQELINPKEEEAKAKAQ